ncbi:hypothetical protein BS47DRAFT_391480 [Hydnum rufescens UP504]|uniref:Uncharacterized protein n=1 Tax=Hydnum rufescens UP504 TaxID=1448309 RepID=A0A9P6AIY1_9AGAM|nr:hypothetical protein BS47DRAFT_391480 [Hydnum rufescens UP504]
MNVTHIVGGSFSGGLSALCFGVLTVQTSSYYRTFSNDGRSVKPVVWTLEAFQLICSTQYLYWCMVTNYQNPLALNQVTWVFMVFQITAVGASVTMETFFAHRVYSLSTKLHLGMLVQVLALLLFGFGAGWYSSFNRCHLWCLTVVGTP